jgi:hypothetical protein
MRTTVTVDDDVELLLRQAMQRTGQSFKATLNYAIRRGLADAEPTSVEEPFVVKASSMGLREGLDPTRLQEFADELEVQAFLDLTRRLSEPLDKQSDDAR